MSPAVQAGSAWSTTSFTDFNGTGRSFKDCVINGTGNDSRVELARVGDWVQKTNSGPTGREACPMAAIGTDDSLLVFGGYDSSGLVDDTWVYDLGENKWTKKAPADSPEVRYFHALAPVFNDDKVVLFGGYDWANYPYLYFNDTWVYDQSDDEWYLQDVTDAPGGRYAHAMASVFNDDKVVLFGGRDEYDEFGDTWIYDIGDARWTQVFPASSPSFRSGHAMATIAGDDKVLLFGGYSQNTGYMRDTWVFDLSDNQWYRKSPPNSPSSRENTGLATVYGSDKVVLFSGSYNMLTDTWVYDLGDDQWTSLSPAHKPPARYSFGMATPYNTNKPVIFGGWGSGGELSDTWMYYMDGYSQTGQYLSPEHDTGGNTSYLWFNFTADVPPGTGLKFQLRSGETSYALESRNFIGPSGAENSYYTENGQVYYGHYGDRWVQYKAYLNTSNVDITPSIREVVISLNRFPLAPDLMSPSNDTWTNTSRPVFRWAFNDTDSQQQGAFEWQMGRFPDPTTMNHTSGETASNETAYLPDDTLDEGFWFWRVRTQDIEGEWGPFSDFFKISVDRTPPRAFAPWAVPSSWTNDRCSVWFSTSDDFSGIENNTIWIDGKPYGAQDSPFEVPRDLPDGVHNVLVRAFDKAGNFMDAKLRIFLDKTPPLPFTPAAIPPSWSKAGPLLEFSAKDNASGIGRYEVSVDRGPFTRQKSPVALTDLQDGPHDVIVRAYDVAGNYRDANLTVYSDRTAPDDLFVSLTPLQWTAMAPVLEFYGSDAASDIDHYEVKVDGGNFTNRTSPFTLANLTDGIHVVTLRAYDLAGNYAEEEVQALFDRTPPNNFTPEAEPANWTRLDPTISFSTTDDWSGIFGYELKVDAGKFSKAKSPYTLRDIPDGEHLVTVRAIDNAGNYIEGNVTVRVDRSPPDPVSILINQGRESTGRRQVTLTISARDASSGPDQMCFSTDGIAYTDWEPFSSEKAWTLTSGKGEKTVYVKVKDHTGNEARAASATVSYLPPEAKAGLPVTVYIGIGLAIVVLVSLFMLRRMRGRKAPAAPKAGAPIAPAAPASTAPPAPAPPASTPTVDALPDPARQPAAPQDSTTPAASSPPTSPPQAPPPAPPA